MQQGPDVTVDVAGLLGLFCVLLFGAFILAAMVFWIWMLVDCLSNEPSGNDKIMWVVVILLTHWLGALLYYFIRRPQRLRGGR